VSSFGLRRTGEDTDLLEQVQWMAARVIRGLEYIMYKERLGDPNLFSLTERRLSEILLCSSAVSCEGIKKTSALFGGIQQKDKRQQSQFTVKKFWLEVKQNVTMRILKQWDGCLGGLWNLQPWRCSEVGLEKALSNLL